MKIVKGFFNFLGILAAIIFSLVLILMLIVTPLVATASSFLKAETIHNIVNEIDVSAFVESNIENVSMDTQVLESFMETELADEMISLYVDNVFAELIGVEPQTELTEETLKSLFKEHREELLPIVKAVISAEYEINTDMKLSDENMQLIVDQFIENIVPGMLSVLPSLDQIGLDEVTISVIQNLYNGVILKVMLAVTAFITVMILLCRFPRLKGFMWLGVVYLISAVPVLLISLLARSGNIIDLAGGLSQMEEIVTPVITILSEVLLKGTGLIALFGVVFIVIFIVGRKLIFAKRRQIM